MPSSSQRKSSIRMNTILGCVAWRYLNLPIARPELPHLARWAAELQERPGYSAHVMLPLT